MSIRPANSSDEITPAIRAMAASWVVRRDRGLTPAESGEFERWLGADPRHAAAIARSSRAWELIDRAPESATVIPARAFARGPRWQWPATVGLAAAAAAVGAFFLGHSRPSSQEASATTVTGPLASLVAASPTPSVSQSSPPEPVTPDTQLLPDGTIVRLGSDSQVVEEFTPTERRVRLARGEAYFTVTKDPQRPFFVQAGSVVVRAVGTAFNVQLQSQSVEVLVAEGTVQVAPEAAAPSPAHPSPEAPLVAAGHRAVVTLASHSPAPIVTVSALPAEELADALAQRERMLRLSGATLAELVAEFTRWSGTRVTIADPALATLRIGGRFRSDDLEGFVRVLEASYGIRSERAADGAIVLGKRP